jgi:3',5'-cyclic AMP phosphodiesterase CpdA
MIMKTMKKVLAAALMCGSIAFMSCSDSEDDPIIQPEGRDDKPKTEYNIFLMSDIHVMAPELLVNEGEAFENYLKSDPKLLEESGEMLESVVDEILTRRPDLVLIPGDLTKDGEMASHKLVVSILKRINTEGIPVVVVPGNHDIDNPEGVYFQGDKTTPAERTSPEQFAQLYQDFGYGRPETKRDPASLSYVCEPLEGLVLICLDTNLYEENLFIEKGDSIDHNQTAGRIREATLSWMWEQADAAHAQGKQVVVMQHHNAIEHFDGQSIIMAPYVVENYKDVAEGMMQHGIHLVITGHQHMQDIAQYRVWQESATDSLIDITTSSTVAYPNAWRMLKVNLDFTKWRVSTEYTKSLASVSDVQQTCKQRLQDNVVGGLTWHIREYWPTINGYRSMLTGFGLPSTLLPETPEETGVLITKHLGSLLGEVYLMSMVGNEGENPRSSVIVDEVEAGVESLLQEAFKGKMPDEQSSSYIPLLKGMAMAYIKPYLTSMVTDTNQYDNDLVSSVTNDVEVMLTLPGHHSQNLPE